MQTLSSPPGYQGAFAQVRFGITASRHHARRATQRNAVKRILREAARHGADSLAQAAPGQRVDIVLRLKAPLPDRAQASWSKVKADLRAEAESLIAQLRRKLLGASHSRSRPLSGERAGVSR